jgi:hypothetical protein
MSSQYEVLSPWAEVDPVPLKGISPRVTDLKGKKIGLLFNGKRASQPIMTVLEQRLKERFPTSEFTWFGPTGNVEVLGAPDQAFEKWVEESDAIIAAVGD